MISKADDTFQHVFFYCKEGYQLYIHVRLQMYNAIGSKVYTLLIIL